MLHLKLNLFYLSIDQSFKAMSSAFSIGNIESIDEKSFSDIGVQVDILSHHSVQSKSQHFVDLGKF